MDTIDPDDFDDSDLEFGLNADFNCLDDDADEIDTVIDLKSESAPNNFSGIPNGVQNDNLCLAPKVKVSESTEARNKNGKNLDYDKILQGRVLRVVLERVDLSKYGLDERGQPLNDRSRSNESSKLKTSTTKCGVFKLKENGISSKSVEVLRTKVDLKSKDVQVDAAKVQKKNDFSKGSELQKSKCSRETLKIPVNKISSKVLSKDNILKRVCELNKDETSGRAPKLPSNEALAKVSKVSNLQKNVLDKISKTTKTKLSSVKNESPSVCEFAKDGDSAKVTKSSKTKISVKASGSTNSNKDSSSKCKITSSTSKLLKDDDSTEITELPKTDLDTELKKSKKNKILSNCKAPSLTSKLSNVKVAPEITELPKTNLLAVKDSELKKSKKDKVSSKCKITSSTSKLLKDDDPTEITELPKTDSVAVKDCELKKSKKNKILSNCKRPSSTSKLSNDAVSTEITELPKTEVAKIYESKSSKKSKILSNSAIPLLTSEPSKDDVSTEMFEAPKNKYFLEDFEVQSNETLTEASKSPVDNVLTQVLHLPDSNISTVVSCHENLVHRDIENSSKSLSEEVVDQDKQQSCFDALHKAKKPKSNERIIEEVIENMISAVIDVIDDKTNLDERDVMETEQSGISSKRKIEEPETTDINDDSTPALPKVLTEVSLNSLYQTRVERVNECAIGERNASEKDLRVGVGEANDELLFSATSCDDANITVKKIKLSTETTLKRNVMQSTDDGHRDKQELELLGHVKHGEVDESSSSSLSSDKVQDSLAIETESAITAANDSSETIIDKSNCDLNFDKSLAVSRVDLNEKSVETLECCDLPSPNVAASSMDTDAISDVNAGEGQPSGTVEVKKDREKRIKEKGFLNPVANLTKSERRLRKIKRCSGMSKEYYQKVKSLMKTFPKLRLIEVVKLHKLDQSEIVKLTSVRSNTEHNTFPLERTKSISRVPKPVFTRPKMYQKFKENELKVSSDREKSRVKEKHRKPKKESHLDALERVNTLLANRISNLPRIPRKLAIEAVQDNNVNPLTRVTSDTKAATDFKIEIKKRETKVTRPVQSHRGVVTTPKEISGDQDFDIDCWNKTDFDEFLTLFTENGPSQPERDSGSDVLPLRAGNKVANAENLKKMQSQHRNEFGRSKCSNGGTVKNVVKGENLGMPIQRETETKESTGGKHVALQCDRLSTCAQWSDDEISILAPSVDSAFSIEEDVPKTCAIPASSNITRPHKPVTESLRTYTHPYGYERFDIWEPNPETELDEDRWEEMINAEMTSYEWSDEAGVRQKFEDELKNMSHLELTDLINNLSLSGNLPKSLLVFERLSEYDDSELVMKNLLSLFVVARSNNKCLPYVIIKFTKIIISHATKCKKILEKINLLYMLFEWLCDIEVESDGQLVIENCRISNGCLFALLGRDFSRMIEIYNNTMIDALNEDVCEILYLFRYGKKLQLTLDFSVIRALVSAFAERNIWSLCQEVYTIGCGLACYSRIKLKRWPISFTIKSYYTKGEISILLYDFLFKFQKLLNTSFFRDRRVIISKETAVYIRLEDLVFEDHHNISCLTRVNSKLESIYDRLTNVLKSMVGRSVLMGYIVDSNRAYVTMKMPLLEMLLKHSQNWFKRYNMTPFCDYRKPGPLDWYSYRMLSTNGSYCQYDRNPFN